MKSKKKNEWLVATRTGKPPKGFKKNEVFVFSSREKAISFMREVTKNNVECLIGRPENE